MRKKEEIKEVSLGSLAYTVIRTDRRSISLSVDRECKVIVRAPRQMTDRRIADFVLKHRIWLLGALKRAEAHMLIPEPSEDEIRLLRMRAKKELPPKIEHYASLMGVKPTGFRVTSAKTRFGSCSPKNSLSFSLYLMRWQEEAIDYVVVHELAHIIHKNHSKAFYSEIEKILPDHRARRALLKESPIF